MKPNIFFQPTISRTIWWIGLAAGILALWGCHRQEAPWAVHQWRGQQLGQVYLEEFLKQHPLPDGESYRADTLGASESASYHLVQIRDRERPHVHQTHDLTAMLLQGSGQLYVGTTVMHVEAGAVVSIPRNVAHYFVNDDPDKPAVVYAIFSPALEEPDVLVIEQAASGFGEWRTRFAAPRMTAAQPVEKTSVALK